MGWNRKELKKEAKVALKKQYWKLVLVSLLIILAVNGGGSVGSAASEINFNDDYEDDYDYEEDFEDEEYVSTAFSQNVFRAQTSTACMVSVGVAALLTVFVLLIIFVLIAVSLAFMAFVISPLEIGARRCTILAYDEEFSLKELGYGFEHSYMSNVKTLFWRNMYVFFWTLLLFVPGIIKGYEYKMIPFILAENPDLTKKEAFQLSKEMMYGNKWKAFVLDLSFLGWHLLSLLTLGVLAAFYVNPYQHLTDAGLYRSLRATYRKQIGSDYAGDENVTMNYSYDTGVTSV